MGFGARKFHNAPNHLFESDRIPKTHDDIKIHTVDGERYVEHADYPTRQSNRSVSSRVSEVSKS